MLCSHFKNIQVDGWAALPNIPCHGPAYFVLMLCRFATASNERLVVLPQTRSNSNHAVGSTFPPDGMKLFRNIPFLGWSCYPKHGPVPSTVLKNFFVLMLCSHFKNIQVHGWAALPNIPVTAQLILRRSTFLSSWCYADYQQRTNERLLCSPKHGSAYITLLKQFFVRMIWNFSKTCKSMATPCFPKHGPVPFTMLKKLFVWMLCRHFENIQVDGWAALPNIPCHGPVHFAASKILFVWMLCRFSTTFKWTVGRAPPSTVQLKSQRWVIFSSGWRETFQKHSKFWLDRALPNTAQFYSRCWRTFSSGCYAAISKTSELMVGPSSPTSPVTAQLISRR